MVEDQVKPINFIVELGAASQWQSVQRRVAARAIMAHMIAAPRLGKHRRIIALKLLDGDHYAIKAESTDAETKKIANLVKKLIKVNSNSIRTYESPSSQRQRLFFDPGASGWTKSKVKKRKEKKKSKKLIGQESRAVLTAGLIVLIFDWAERLGYPLQLTEAKEFLEKRGGEAFWGNQVSFYKSGINDAWKDKRDIAHLCAAFAVFLDQRAVPSSNPDIPFRRFSAVEERDLIRHADEFLASAMWFEGVLQRVEKRAHVTMKLDLRSLPVSLSLQTLPHAGVAIVPDRFKKVLVAWRDGHR